MNGPDGTVEPWWLAMDEDTEYLESLEQQQQWDEDEDLEDPQSFK